MCTGRNKLSLSDNITLIYGHKYVFVGFIKPKHVGVGCQASSGHLPPQDQKSSTSLLSCYMRRQVFTTRATWASQGTSGAMQPSITQNRHTHDLPAPDIWRRRSVGTKVLEAVIDFRTNTLKNGQKLALTLTPIIFLLLILINKRFIYNHFLLIEVFLN